MFGDGVQLHSESGEGRTAPLTVRGAIWKPLMWTIAAAAVTVLGVRMASAAEFYGDAAFTRVAASAFTIGFGFGATVLGIQRLRTRVRVFPDRLEATVGLGRKDVVLPGDVVVIRPTGSGHVGIRGVTGRRGSSRTGSSVTSTGSRTGSATTRPSPGPRTKICSARSPI